MLGPIFMGVSHTWRLSFMYWNQQTADYYVGHCTWSPVGKIKKVIFTTLLWAGPAQNPPFNWRKYGAAWGSLFHNHSTALDVIISFLSTAENKTTLIFQLASTAWQLNSELKSFVLLLTCLHTWRHRHLKKIDSVARYLIIFFCRQSTLSQKWFK